MLELISIKRKEEYSINASALWRATRREHVKGTYFCSGCGIAYKTVDEVRLENFTHGCRACQWRKDNDAMKARTNATTRQRSDGALD